MARAVVHSWGLCRRRGSDAAGLGWGATIMCGAAAGRCVIAAVGLDRTAFAVHGARPCPVSQRVIRAGLIAALRRRIEDAVDTQYVLAAAGIRGIGVEDFAGLVLVEDAAAGQIL